MSDLFDGNESRRIASNFIGAAIRLEAQNTNARFS